MVVTKPVLEKIWNSLENIQEFVISSKISKVDKKVLTMIESDLLNLEHKMRLFANYRPPRRTE